LAVKAETLHNVSVLISNLPVPKLDLSILGSNYLWISL